MKTKYKYYPNRPDTLTEDFLKKEFSKLTSRIKTANTSNSAASWIDLFTDWNALMAYIDSEGSRINFRFSLHMDDPKLEQADEYFREKIQPALVKPTHQLMKGYLDSPHRTALDKRFGKQLSVVYENALKPFDPINTTLSVKESNLTTKYDKLKGSAEVVVRSEPMTLAKAGSLIESPVESLRKEAWLASRGWYLKNREQMADIFQKLVDIRTAMGKNLGYENFIPLAYQMRGRSDYGRTEVESFRNSVKKYLVPLNRELSRQHAESLGKKIVKPWDGYDPRFSLPLGIAQINQQLSKSQALFDELSPKIGKHFASLRKNKLIDLESRPGKQTNPFCTAFYDTGEAAILCSSTGNAGDITTLLHESGHAFQALESSPIEAVDLHWGTADLAEIPSTAMEYLSLPKIEIFFSAKESQKYISNSLSSFIGMSCYICLVDEFQHLIYEQPGMSHRQRDAKWGELADSYLSPTDYRGYEQYKNLRWYAQMHIFGIPFYYIDYALAEVCAMQIAMIDAVDHKRAMKIYMELCRLGGTKSFLEAVKHVGLRSPFEGSLIRDLAAHTAKELDLD